MGKCKPNSSLCGMKGGLFNPFFTGDYNWWAGGAAFTAEYQLVLNRATTEGFTLPSAEQQTRENLKISRWKANGKWALMDCYFNHTTDGDINYTRINWKDPTGNLATNVGTLTFGPGLGITGAGGHIILPWGPSDGINYTLNLCAIGAYEGDNQNTLSSYLFSVFDAGTINGTMIVTRSNETTGFRVNSTASASPPPTTPGSDSIGMWELNRSSSNLMEVKKNKVSVTTSSAASTARSSQKITLLALNVGGTISNSGTRNVKCFYAGAQSLSIHDEFMNFLAGV